MKTTFLKNLRLSIPAAFAALCLLAPRAHADWASIHSNNRPDRARSHLSEERVRERRRLDIEPERRNGFYWAGFHPGMLLHSLPFGYVQASVGTTGYYYYDGVYFQPTTEGSYAVVPPPVGATVPRLPDGAEQMLLGAAYYYAGGAFYLAQPNGFLVVSAPAGVTVTELPYGATPVTINRVLYFLSGTTYFMPVMQGGVTAYVTAQPLTSGNGEAELNRCTKQCRSCCKWDARLRQIRLTP